MQKTVLFCLMLILLSACSNKTMISDFEESRKKVNDRLGVESASEDSLKKWYSWNNNTSTNPAIALDETPLLEAKVVNIIDGDTIDVVITNGETERVRLILVDTPESKGKYEDNPEPYAIAAYEFTKTMLLDKTIWLEKGIEERDRYGRLLAYVWLDNVVLNEEVEEEKEVAIIGEKVGKITLNELLVKEGFARVAVFPPNTKYVDEMEKTQKNAKKNKKGLWAE